MIISASRRTDVASFYAEWFLRRIREGYCEVRNPYNPAQVSRISLRCEDVDGIVFWTRNPRPLMARLDELDGYRYYFQFTVVHNGRAHDGKSPGIKAAVETFKRLSERATVIWRYDPIVATVGVDHAARFEAIASALRGHTDRCVISLVDAYRKTERRMAELRGTADEPVAPDVANLIPRLAAIARSHGMDIVSCAEEVDLTPYGVRPGRCIDPDLLGLGAFPKDPSQRAACGCVVSRDIGAYDTCLFECRYCYATSSFERSRERHAGHDPAAPSLV